jgi:hypothetical protein
MAATRIVGQADAPVRGQERAELRRTLHDMWSAVSGGWAEHADYVDRRAAALTEGLLELSRPHSGDRVLELACGPGGLGLAAAERVAPDGDGVLSDVAPEMVAIAQRAPRRSAWPTSRPRHWTSSASTSPTSHTTSCSVARDSCSRSSRRAPPARSGASFGPAAEPRSRCGVHVSPTRGSTSSCNR